MSDTDATAGLPTAAPGVELACALAHFDLRNPLPRRAYQLIVEKLLRHEPSDDYLSWQQRLHSLDPRWMDTDPAISFGLAGDLLDFVRERERIAATALAELDPVNFAIEDAEIQRVDEMTARAQNRTKQILKFWDYQRKQVPAEHRAIEQAA